MLDIRVSPVESEPLAHFLPGTSVLHIGPATASFLADGSCRAADVVEAAQHLRCSSIDVSGGVDHGAPVLTELIEVVRSARLRSIAVVPSGATPSLEAVVQCDAVVVEMSTTAPGWVQQLVDDDGAWVEILARLSPDHNDGDASIHQLTSWVASHLGTEIPVHFAAVPRTPMPHASLRRARSIGLGDGLHYVYTAPLDDRSSGTTLCPGCGEHLVERTALGVTAYRLTATGRCHACGTCIVGRFNGGSAGRAVAVALAPDPR